MITEFEDLIFFFMIFKKQFFYNYLNYIFAHLNYIFAHLHYCKLFCGGFELFFGLISLGSRG